MRYLCIASVFYFHFIGKRPYPSAFYSCTIYPFRLHSFSKVKQCFLGVQRIKSNGKSVSMGPPLHCLYHQLPSLLQQLPSRPKRQFSELYLQQYERSSARSDSRFDSTNVRPSVSKALFGSHRHRFRHAGSALSLDSGASEFVVCRPATPRCSLNRRSSDRFVLRSPMHTQRISRSFLCLGTGLSSLLLLSRAGREAEYVSSVPTSQCDVQREGIDGETPRGLQTSVRFDQSRLECRCRIDVSSVGAASAGSGE